MSERKTVAEFYDDVKDFEKELLSINVRKISNPKVKETIQKLKRWYKTYWNESGMDLYESQALKVRYALQEQGLETKIKVDDELFNLTFFEN